MSALENPVVQTKSGKIEGLVENGLWVFKGIPYAAPPLGDLRWAPPQPHADWNGIRPALEFGKVAPQNPTPLLAGEAVETAEDCLFLNVWTPGLDAAKRPVMVWIHGGAFIFGSGTQIITRSGKLAKNGNVVLVTINYRMGVLGFLKLDTATQGKIPATGNEGLFDQIAALQWVKDNIAAFGGDPENVTVFGESAGGMSIACMLAMPAAKGMFHKAILESGVGSTARPVESCSKVGEDFLKLAGSNVDQLRSLPVDALLKIQSDLTRAAGGALTPVAPVIDGITLMKPLDTIKGGSAPGVKMIIGTNLEETKLFENMNPNRIKPSSEEMLKQVLEKTIPPDKVAKVISIYHNALDKRGVEPTPAAISSAIQTDMMFRIPALRTIEARCHNNEEAYSYIFTWKSPVMNGIFGACHALEIGFVFGTADSTFCGSGPDVDKLSDEIQIAWTNFARTGNPGSNSLGEWKPYCGKRYTMLLGKISYLDEAPYEDERAIWDEVGI